MSLLVLDAAAIGMNPIPLAGQPVLDVAGGVLKVGDGRTPWSGLPECPPDLRARLGVSS